METKEIPFPDIQMGERLGVGGYGAVYEAHDTETGNIYALKIIHKKLLEKKNETDLFMNEVNVMKKLKSKYLAKFVNFAEDEKNYYVLMERCYGISLWNFLSTNDEIPESTSNYIFKRILRAVNHMHKSMITHGDLKPENIMVDPKTFTIKIIDFGFSRFASFGLLFKPTNCSVSYSSPEILKGELYNPYKADVWALGVIFYTMLAKKTPFYTGNVDEEIRNIIKGNYEMPPGLSKIQQKIIRGALRVDPKERYSIKDIQLIVSQTKHEPKPAPIVVPFFKTKSTVKNIQKQIITPSIKRKNRLTIC